MNGKEKEHSFIQAQEEKGVIDYMFCYIMHGEDWESVVDNDTVAIHEHASK
ncbi:hypothetical protein [Desulfosporosinus sp. SB140]|uniref:hypothetical protein n=1 Tax=Desulfosporosinus paludis TaxID=3115649 RepID=UPI003890FD14